MRNDRGITIAALILYIIISLIILTLLGYIVANFRKNLNDLNVRTVHNTEFDKLNAQLLKEVKDENEKITKIDNSEIIFNNGNTYTYNSNDKKVYLNGSIEIASYMDDCQFYINTRNNKHILYVTATIGDVTRATEYVITLANADVDPDDPDDPDDPVETNPLKKYEDTPADGNVDEKDILGNEITIPDGFTIVPDGTDGVVYDYYGNEEKIPCVQDGIVIKDSEGNEFVWIPIEEITNKDGTKTTIKLGRYTFADNGTETIKQTATSSGSGTTITIDSYYQELKTSESSGSNNTTAIDIDEFCKLAIANGGYYIARYQSAYGEGGTKALSIQSTNATDSSSITKTKGYLWNYITQPNAATKSRNLYKKSESPNLYSDLMNSFAWDTAIVFIQKYSGNSSYSRQNSKNTSLGISGERTDGTVDKMCNIYDMKSNVVEWTTEHSIYASTTYSYPCTHRGCGYYADYDYTCVRRYDRTTDNHQDLGFRITLYVK